MLTSVYSIPIIGAFTSQLNTEIDTLGLQRAFENTLKHSSSTLIVHGMTVETMHALRQQPTVVVMNHPYDSDIFCLLGSLPTRKDTYMITNATMMGVVPNLDKHFIPVYIQHHMPHNKIGRLVGKLIQQMYHTQTFSQKVEHEKNIQSIRQASMLLKKGSLIVMFPNPGVKKHKHPWYSGIGYLLKGAQETDQLRVVFAYIQGTSNIDYLRFLPYTGYMLPSINITFGIPLSVRTLLRLHPRNITKELEKKYTIWTRTIPS